jgi:uncharacterized membrane-anchored protein
MSVSGGDLLTAQSSILTTCLGLGVLLGFGVNANAQQDRAAEFAALDWQAGPTEGDLGIAKIAVPEGYQFVGRGGAGKFMELNENPSDGKELGILVNVEEGWFVVFSFSPEGYIKDDERDLDADEHLASFKKGTEQGNKVRRERGWSTMEILGWQQPPFYDPRTNNLTWSIRGRSDGSTSVNHSTRLLGRKGVMSVDLVLSSEQLSVAVPAFDSLLTGFSFNTGERYAEFRRGDKVAAYGLAGLIGGGVGVALVKTGLLQKFWKLIVFAFIALASGAKKIFGALGRKGEAADQRSHG